MPELIAISYPSETLAGKSAAELQRVAAEILLHPEAVGQYEGRPMICPLSRKLTADLWPIQDRSEGSSTDLRLPP